MASGAAVCFLSTCFWKLRPFCWCGATWVASRVARLLLEAEELEFVPCSDLFLETFEGREAHG